MNCEKTLAPVELAAEDDEEEEDELDRDRLPVQVRGAESWEDMVAKIGKG